VALAHEIGGRQRSPRRACLVEANEPVVGVYDQVRVGQLLENLIENAVKYSPAGGRIRIKIWRDAQLVWLTVSDEGIGIPAVDLPNVFDRFYRAGNVDDRRFAGMGLGLFICRGIVEAIVGTLLIANLANTVSEFADVAASMEIFGINKYISVPLAALGVWLLIIKGSYKMVERIFLVASALYLAYVASGIMANPPWHAVALASVTPTFRFDTGFVTIVVTVIGTTIAPWMQFYQQASIVDKGLRVEDYGYERLDVIIGSVFAVVVAAFITIACVATLFTHGLRIETAKDAALALVPLAGPYAAILFALGLLNASRFSAAILPLSTAYVVCEALGWESGVSRTWKEAPVFFGVYTALIVLGNA